MDKLFKGFVAWTDTFFEDTARKLVKVCRILSKVFVWINIVGGWVAMIVSLIIAIASKEAGAIFAALLCPVWGYLSAILIALAFALSIMTLNALADINAIRGHLDAKDAKEVITIKETSPEE